MFRVVVRSIRLLSDEQTSSTDALLSRVREAERHEEVRRRTSRRGGPARDELFLGGLPKATVRDYAVYSLLEEDGEEVRAIEVLAPSNPDVEVGSEVQIRDGTTTIVTEGGEDVRADIPQEIAESVVPFDWAAYWRGDPSDRS